jgi:hypothetical protein
VQASRTGRGHKEAKQGEAAQSRSRGSSDWGKGHVNVREGIQA